MTQSYGQQSATQKYKSKYNRLFIVDGTSQDSHSYSMNERMNITDQQGVNKAFLTKKRIEKLRNSMKWIITNDNSIRTLSYLHAIFEVPIVNSVSTVNSTVQYRMLQIADIDPVFY